MSDDVQQPDEGEGRVEGETLHAFNDPPLALYGKLSKVQIAMDKVVKNGDGEGYNYARAEDVLMQVRDSMNAVGLLVLPAATGVQRRSEETITTVALHYKLVDSESGESETLEWRGSGEDRGEKGLYQAYTGGLKYFLLDLFLLPTFDDPEKLAGESTERPPLQVVGGGLGDIERAALVAALDANGIAEGDQNIAFEWSATLTSTDYQRWLDMLTTGESTEVAAGTIVATAKTWKQEAAAA